MKKIKIAIFDLTDCEGCELQFLALREKLVKAGHDFEITNWRLANRVNSPGPFDITFIEGSPITESDVEVIKQARKVSEKIITLGICAAYGGLQSALPETARSKNLKDIYGPKYKPNSKAPKPVSYYIDVDIHLPGCPVNPAELEKLLSSLFIGKKWQPAYYPVCLECKATGTACLFLEEGFCMGPVTKGGCDAICPKAGMHCRGCFGPIPDANLIALKNSTKHLSEQEFENSVKLYFAQSNEYKEYKAKVGSRKKKGK